jgi:SAM-dependent methyltransferase
MTGRATHAYGEKGTTWVDRFGVWLSQRAIRGQLPSRNDLRVLELGCGYHAAQLFALQDRLAHGTGVDFRIAPELPRGEKFSFFEGAIDDVLPRVESNAYDAVLLISVLEHLADPGAVLSAVRQRLRPGGILLVNVPTWRGKYFLELSAFCWGLSPKVEMDDHKMYYDKRDLWPLLVRAGFKPSGIQMRYHKFGLNLFATAKTLPDG